MKRSRTRIGLAVALGGVLVGSTAWGQTPTIGWAVNRFEPTAAGDVFFASDFATYSGSRTVAVKFGAVMDYGYRPVVLRQENREPVALIEHMANLHAQVNVAVLNRFDINLSLPFTLVEAGSASAGINTGIMALGSPAVGDIRLGGRVRIFGEADKTPFSLHLGAQMFMGFIPYSNKTFNVTDGDFRARVYAALAGRASILRWSFTFGFHARPKTLLGDTMGATVGSDLFATAALGFTFLQDRLTIGPEFWASTVLDAPFTNTHTNAELALGAHYLIADVFQVGLGGGLGLFRGAGTPAARVMLQLAYAPADKAPAKPAILDTDSDGVLDPDDLCVTVPQGPQPDPARRGCPIDDRDKDGVLDPDDLCIDVPQGANPDPNRKGCPDPDSDSDGVFDSQDKCPTTPKGDHPDPEMLGCPDGDDDADTVLNHDDQCRTEPQGYHADADRPGCPAPDRDKDQVPDPVDHCPDQPGQPSTDPIKNGCPGLLRVDNGQLTLLNPVFFATNRDVILPRSFPVLNAVVDAMKAFPEIKKVVVEGHTDDVGDDTRNLDLSNRRAASVVKFLTDHNIEASRLEAHGFGETMPLTPIPGLTGRQLRDARSQNRRVIFRVTDPAPPTAASH